MQFPAERANRELFHTGTLDWGFQRANGSPTSWKPKTKLQCFTGYSKSSHKESLQSFGLNLDRKLMVGSLVS